MLYPRDAGVQRTDGIPDLLDSHLVSVMVTADTRVYCVLGTVLSLLCGLLHH